MSRKKTAKRAVKRPITINAAPSSQKMEKDFQGAIAKMIAQLNTDLNRLKQQQSKLKATEIKTKAVIQKFTKPVAKAKKKSAAATKQYKLATKTLSTLTKQLNDIAKAITNIAQSNARLVALRKHINQFQQIWVKSIKASKKPKSKNIARSGQSMLSNVKPHSDENHSTQGHDSLEETTELEIAS